MKPEYVAMSYEEYVADKKARFASPMLLPRKLFEALKKEALEH